MASLSEIVVKSDRDDKVHYWLNHKEVLCVSDFAELMNEEELPDRIRVTVSTEPIRGAAEVPVLIHREHIGLFGGKWINEDGEHELLWTIATIYLRKLGIPSERWTDVWVDWEPAPL